MFAEEGLAAAGRQGEGGEGSRDSRNRVTSRVSAGDDGGGFCVIRRFLCLLHLGCLTRFKLYVSWVKRVKVLS